MRNPCRAHRALSIILLFSPVTVPLAFPETAEARGFRAVFRSAGRAIDNVPSARPLVRSAEHVATETRRESHVNWGEVADKGLDAAKTAFDAADKLGQAAGGSSGGSGSGTSGSTTGGAPAGAFSGQTLSRIELEACVRESDTLDKMTDAFDRQKTTMDAERTAIERQQTEIDAARGRVDRRSQRSVNAFNAMIDNYQGRVKRFNETHVRPMEARRTAMNGRIQKFNSFCNGKSYYQSDLTAVETRSGIKLGSN